MGNTSNPAIQIKVTSVLAPINQSFVSSFERNFDIDAVYLDHRELGIRSISPIEIIIEAAAVYIFTELVLKPIHENIAAKLKFNWKTAVSKYHVPSQPLHVTIKFVKERLIVDTGDLMGQNNHKQVWELIDSTLQIIEGNKIEFDKIRLVSGDKDKGVIAICYLGSIPSHRIDFQTKQIIPILK